MGLSDQQSRVKLALHAGSAWQLALMVAVSVGLGVVTLAAALLPSRSVLMVLLVVLAPFVAMIIGVRRPLLLVIALDMPLQIDAYLAHRPEIDDSGAFSGYIVSLTTIALAILYTLWLAEYLAHYRSVAPLRLGKAASLAAYVGMAALSLLVARDRQLALFELFLLGQLLLLFLYIVGTMRTREDVLFLLSVLLLGLIAHSGILVFEWLRGASGRVSAAFASPNAAGGYSALLLAPALGLLLARAGRWYSWLAALAFGLGSLGLVLTFSRGGWIGAILSLGIVMLACWWRGWLAPRVPLVLLVVLLVLGLGLRDQIASRVFGDDGGAAESRIPLLELAGKIIQDHPFSGVGLNNFALMTSQYYVPDLNPYWHSTVHNQFLLVLSETGIGGLTAFLLALGSALRQGWRCWRSNDRTLALLALSLAAAQVGHMTHMLVDFFNQRPHMQLLWLHAALLAALAIIAERNANAPATRAILAEG